MSRAFLMMLLFQSLLSCGENKSSAEDSLTREAMPEKEYPVNATAHTSENSLDWAGSYSGVLPCESCEGIETTLILKEDKTFRQKQRYLATSDEEIKNTEGKFNWNKNGNHIELDGVEGFSKFKVGELYLLPLNEDETELKRVPGNNFYLLKE